MTSKFFNYPDWSLEVWKHGFWGTVKAAWLITFLMLSVALCDHISTSLLLKVLSKITGYY
jgi:hypothetical protein